MAVIDSNQTISSNKNGYQKNIHSSARTMMLDNLQVSMYNKPIPSCVRECVSNAVDSVKEKGVAISILSGKTKVEDHYISKDSVKDKISSEDNDIYADSEFNKEYYDPKYLNPSNTITLTYLNNPSNKKDMFIIEDSGVGLGGRRLEGFFDLGYSTKRLNSTELGGFGLN